jgi:uncharacterized low-complexity protein
MRHRSTLSACAAALAVAVAAPAAHAAKPPRFDLQLTGSQVTTWSYGHIGDGKCDLGANGEGSEQLTYDTGKVRVVAVKPTTGPQKGLPQLTLPGDRMAQYGLPRGIPAVVKGEREGTMDQRAGCGGTGGSTQTVAKDCGPRWGRVTLQVGWEVLAAFRVEGVHDTFGEAGASKPPAPPELGAPLGHVYENCPFLLAQGARAAYDELLPAAKELSARKLPKVGKTLKLSGDAAEELEDGDGERSSKTLVTWNMTLKRVR